MARYAIELLQDEKRLTEMRKAARAVGDGALLLHQDREAVRRFLPASAGALGVEAFRNRAIASTRGRRIRIRVPFPSWLSMVMRAVSP